MTFPSAYTFDVGALDHEGRREITLLHHGYPCFSTSHVAIQSVLLTRFPDLHFISTHEYPFFSCSPSSCIPEPRYPILKGNAHLTTSSAPFQRARKRAAAAEPETATHIPYASPPAFDFAKAVDYLCVFHRDELHRRHEGLPQLSRHPAMVCTSYETSSCTPRALPLPDISPEYFCPGVFGVWIHGKYGACGNDQLGGVLYGNGRASLPPFVEVHHGLYVMVTNLWWMISPLVVQPVYVRQTRKASADAWRTSSLHSSVFSSSPVTHRSSPTPTEMKVAVVKQFMARDQELWTVVQRRPDLLGLAVTSPYYPLDILLWEWLPQTLKLPERLCSPPRLRKTANGITVPTVAAVLSEYPALRKQIIFLTHVHPSPSSFSTGGSPCSTWVYALQTPDLLTREGELTILFTLSPGIHPQVPSVLHCMLPSFCPQPILVTNYPSTNQIALFDVCTLLNAATASTHPSSVSSPSLPPPCPPCALAEKYFACLQVDTALEQKITALGSMHDAGRCMGKRKREESSSRDEWKDGMRIWSGLEKKVAQEEASPSGEEEEEKEARACLPLETPKKEHPYTHWVLNGLLEEEGPQLVLFVSPTVHGHHPPLALHRRRASEEKQTREKECRVGPEKEEGAPPRGSGRVVVVHIPTWKSEMPAILTPVLEIVRSSVGPMGLWELQYAVMREAWQRAAVEKVQSSMLLDVLYATLLEHVCESLYGHGLRSHPAASLAGIHSDTHRPTAVTPPRKRSSGSPENSPFVHQRTVKPPFSPVLHALSPTSSPMLTFDAIEESVAAMSRQTENNITEGGDPNCHAYKQHKPSSSPSCSSFCTTHAPSRVSPWSPYKCGLLLIGLHLLYESAKLQESFWPSLPQLSEVNLVLSQLLQWKPYTLFYQSMLLLEGPFSLLSPSPKPPHRNGEEEQEGRKGMRMGCGRLAALEEVLPLRSSLSPIPSEAAVRDWAFYHGLLLDVSLPYQEGEAGFTRRPLFFQGNDADLTTESEEGSSPLELLPVLRRIVQRKGEGRGGGVRSTPKYPSGVSFQYKMRRKNSRLEGVGVQQEPTAFIPGTPTPVVSPPSDVSWWVMTGLSEEHPVVLSRKVFQLYCLAFQPHTVQVHLLASASYLSALSSITSARSPRSSAASPSWWWRVIAGLCSVECRIPTSVLHQQLSLGVAYPLLQAIALGKISIGDAESRAKKEVLALVGRIDVLATRQVQPCEEEENEEEQRDPFSFAALFANAAPDGIRRTTPMATGNGSRGEEHIIGKGTVTGADVIRLAEERAVSWISSHAFAQEDEGISLPMDFPPMWIDTRLERVLKLLNTTAHTPLLDADVKEGDTKLKEVLRCRVAASPVARGMVTIHTSEYKSCDRIPIPPVNLHGMTETGIVVPLYELGIHGGATPLWPLFHNSCAAGLRFFPFHAPPPDDARVEESFPFTAYSVPREKLIYQVRSVDPVSRPGLLFTAGLLGHFEFLQVTDVYTFLTSPEQDHALRELMAIGVLLGLSCTYRGTSNPTVYKCLSVHILSLTPSEEDVEIQLNVQTAAFVAVGLLFQGQFISSQSFLLEVLLVEMTRRPTDEHFVGRDGYVLGVGICLGLMLLGAGSRVGALSCSTRMVETLWRVMEGGQRDVELGNVPGYDTFQERGLPSQEARETEERIRQSATRGYSCSCVYEGNHYNAVVGGPPAVMALGLIFLKTEEKFVFQRLKLPNSFDDLLFITPTMSLLRSLMAPLIQWSSIIPSREWVYHALPSCLNELFLERLHHLSTFLQQRQYFLLCWSYSIAGTVLALGLRHAGTMDPRARETILMELKGFLRHEIGSSRVRMTSKQKSNGSFERCICCCCLAASVVMAGTGDLELFQIFQQLHRRTGSHETLSYGVHMAVTMSIGFLFLGGGRLTLSNSTTSIAALLIALYPIWPTHVNDNTRHLQALRQLYVLAVVPRVVDAVDVITQRPVSVPIKVVLRRGKQYSSQGEIEARRASGLHSGQSIDISTFELLKEQQPQLEGYEEEEGKPQEVSGGIQERIALREVYMQTPCLYPPPDWMERIEVCSPRHYPVTISWEKGPIPEYGIRLQLLKKTPDGVRLHEEEEENFPYISAVRGYGIHSPPGHHDLVLPHRNSVEGRLVDWVKRFFVQPNIPFGESIMILESIKIIFACQRSFMEELSQSSQHLLSLDVGQTAYKALEARYHAVLENYWSVVRLQSFSDAAPLPPAHPLKLLLVQDVSIGELVEKWTVLPQAERSGMLPYFHNCSHHCAQEEKGSHGIWAFSPLSQNDPHSLIALLRSSGDPWSHSSPSSKPQEWSENVEKRFHHWLLQALCFYDLSSGKQNRLKNALARMQNERGKKQQDGAPEKGTFSNGIQASMILRLQLELGIPYHTLQKIISCCVGDEDGVKIQES